MQNEPELDQQCLEITREGGSIHADGTRRVPATEITRKGGTLVEWLRGRWSIDNRSHYVRDVALGADGSRIREGVRRSRHAMICEAGASHDAFPSGSLGMRNVVTSAPLRKSRSTVRGPALTSWPRWRDAAIGSASHRCNEHRRVALPKRFWSHRKLHQAGYLETVSVPGRRVGSLDDG